MSHFLNLLIRSSADPRKVSLAVKGFVLAATPIAMFFFDVTNDEVGVVADAIEKVIMFGLSFLSAAMILFGLLRKIVLGRWAAKFDWEDYE